MGKTLEKKLSIVSKGLLGLYVIVIFFLFTQNYTNLFGKKTSDDQPSLPEQLQESEDDQEKQVVDTTPMSEKLCHQSNCFDLGIADDSEERTLGLMYRESLPAMSAMLFVFEKSGYYPFWMKNTLIPLDMIYMDEKYTIIDIIHDATPCAQDPCQTYGGKGPTKYVLEVNGGKSTELNILVGATMRRE